MSQKYTKNDDLTINEVDNIKVDLSPFLGKWKNTKLNSGQIPELEIKLVDGQLLLHAFGAYNDGLKDWGTTTCTVFTDNVESDCANAFSAKYSFDQIDVAITSNVKLGVLVVQTYTTFNDNSSRFNYYTREFYGPA